jgi:copper chaperone CopZ
MNTTRYDVAGMTCEHCVRAVTTEVSALDGAQDVVVDLAAGTVTVSSVEPLPLDALREAVDEAGYELTGVSS